MIAPGAIAAAGIISGLLDGGVIAEKDVLHRLALILRERSPTSPNPDGSAGIYLRDIRKLAQDGAVPVHLGRFLNAPQVRQWLAELAPLHEALTRRQAGRNAAAAAQLPHDGKLVAPPAARFGRKPRTGLKP